MRCRNLIALIIFGMLLLIGGPAWAQADDAIESISLEQALELARSSSHEVRQARQEVRKAEIAAEEAWWGRFPTVSADGQYANNIARPVIVLPSDSPFGGGVLETGTRHNLTGNIQASVPIYSRQLNQGITLSREVLALQEEIAQATERTIELEVWRAYVNGLIAREAWEVLRQSHENLVENLELVRALHQEGMAPEYDLVRTEVQVRNIEPELASAQNNYEGALNYLKLLTGLPISQKIALIETLEELYSDVAQRQIQADFSQNTNLIQLEGQQSILNRQLEMQKSAYWPTLSAFGNFTYQGQGDDLKFWDYTWTKMATVGLAVSVPLFAGGRKQRVDQVRVEQIQAQMQKEFLLESLRAEFDTLENRRVQLVATIEAQERNIAQAERGYSIARASYEEGVHSLMDVNDAERALREARLNYQLSLNDYINAILDIETLVGNSQADDARGE